MKCWDTVFSFSWIRMATSEEGAKTEIDWKLKPFVLDIGWKPWTSETTSTFLHLVYMWRCKLCVTWRVENFVSASFLYLDQYFWYSMPSFFFPTFSNHAYNHFWVFRFMLDREINIHYVATGTLRSKPNIYGVFTLTKKNLDASSSRKLYLGSHEV